MIESKSRSKKFFYNTLFTALLQIANILTALIVPKFMIKYYGSEINGLVTSITQFIAYFNLVEAGISNAAVYALYKPLADNNEGRISSIISASKKFYIQSGCIFTTLVFLLAIVYPLYVRIDGFSSFRLGVLIIVLGSNGFLEFFTLSKYRVLLTADQKTYVISIASIMYTLLQTLIIAVMATFKISIVIVRSIAVLSIVLRSIILSTYCKLKYKYVNYKAVPDMKALDNRWDAMFLQVLGAIHQGATVILLTLIVKDFTIISIYSVFNIVISGINRVLGIFNSGLAASFGQVIAKGEKNILRKSFREFEFGFYTLNTVIFGVAFVMIMPFVNLYTEGITDVNYNMPLLGFMMLIDGYLYQIKTPQGMLVISAGMYKETKWRSFTQGVIALVGGAILSFWLGIYGIIFAAIVSNLYRDIDLCFFASKYITGLNPIFTVKNIATSLLQICLIVLPFHFIKLTINSWLEWLIYSCLIVFHAGLIVLIFSLIFDRMLLKSVFKRVKNILNRT